MIGVARCVHCIDRSSYLPWFALLQRPNALLPPCVHVAHGTGRCSYGPWRPLGWRLRLQTGALSDWSCQVNPPARSDELPAMVHASTAHVGAVGPMQAQCGCECHLQLQGWASHQAALVRAADQVARPIMPVGSYDDYAGMLWSAAPTRAAWWPVHPCSWSCTPWHSVPVWRAPVPACAVDA